MKTHNKTPRVVLHLGFHKTGTSFLQEKIFPLLQHVNLITSSDLINWELKKDKLNIISCEALSKSIPHYKMYSSVNRYTTLELLHDLFPDAKIVIATRNQQNRLQSCYAQYVKNCGSYTFEQYTKKYHDSLSMTEYVTQVKHCWNDVFIFTYANFKDNKTSVIRSLFELLDISEQFDDVADAIEEDVYINKSPSTTKIRGWRFINSLLSKNVALRKIRRVINGVLLLLTEKNRLG